MEDDPVEPKVVDRRVQIALQHRHIGHRVQPLVELREARGPLRDVDGPYVLGRAGRDQSGHAGAGSEIEQGLARLVRQELEEALRVVGQCREHDVLHPLPR